MNDNEIQLPCNSLRYKQARIAHWDKVALEAENNHTWSDYYHRRLAEIYNFLVPPGQRVIEIGCAQGDLLSALNSSFGVGVDFSGEMIQKAQRKHANLKFFQKDAHNLDLEEKLKFDVIILSDLLNDLWDVQEVFNQLHQLCDSRTRVIINSYSRLWELPLTVAEKYGMAKSKLKQNWLTVEDITNLLYLSSFEVIRHWPEVLWPLETPLLAPFCNRFLVKFWPFKIFGLSNFIIARPNPTPVPQPPLVSIIIPARNEEGNIPQIFERVPEMGQGTEMVFVEGHSTDKTYKVIEAEIEKNPQRQAKLLRQAGKGKGDAVRRGFEQAHGDLLMILDADLTVPPEDLPRFYEAAYSGKAEFVNGVRLVYPMEKEAMRFFNLLGNKFFSLAFSWLLGQPIKDTLCGTKVLWKSDYKRIAANRSYFGEFDPFGDFDLLFGAARLNLKIDDMPIRYRERIYGTTNIKRWQHGCLLLKMLVFAARRLKFV